MSDFYSKMQQNRFRQGCVSLSCQAVVAPEAVWQVGRPPYQSEIWYSGAIPMAMKFGQLILGKIVKIIATRCQIFTLKCSKIDFGRAPPQTV